MMKMKRILCASLIILALAVCAGPGGLALAEAAVPEKNSQVSTSSVTSDPKESPEQGFSYVHDPRTNPEAMKDIVENADAVYGFSPNPESTRLGSFASFDWTDPEYVVQAKEERIAYHESLESLTDILYRMRDEGASIEEMARAVSIERNRLRLASYEDNPEGLAEVKKSNLETYGHEDGPTPDELYEKYGSWITVLQKSFSTNMGMDACCGLYDEYYQLYIELGYVTPDPTKPDTPEHSNIEDQTRVK